MNKPKNSGKLKVHKTKEKLYEKYSVVILYQHMYSTKLYSKSLRPNVSIILSAKSATIMCFERTESLGVATVTRGVGFSQCSIGDSCVRYRHEIQITEQRSAFISLKKQTSNHSDVYHCQINHQCSHGSI